MVMEASGACTEPVYYALAGQDFEEIAMASPAHAKALRGHKTDAKDCARLAELSGCGLLRGSYIPSPELKEVQDEDGAGPHPRRSSGCRRDDPAAGDPWRPGAAKTAAMSRTTSCGSPARAKWPPLTAVYFEPSTRLCVQ